MDKLKECHAVQDWFSVDLAVSLNGGPEPQFRPRTTVILIMGIKRYPPNVGKPCKH